MKKILVALVLLSLPAVWVLVSPGGYEPHDLHHLADIYQMHRAFSTGQIPPRMGPDFLFGFGYPLFNFYYVLPFYLGVFFYSLGANLMASLKLVFLVSAVGSVWGMYLLLNKFFGRWASGAGALLYLYTPFRAVEIYVRGAVGEALAIAILPWVLYVLASLIERTDRKNLVAASVVLAFFYLTHNYFFIMAVPFAGVFVLFLILKNKEKIAKTKAVFAAGFLSAGLSAYWWLPAFFEHNLVASSTPFALEDHFPFVKQLVIPSWGYGSSVWGPGDEISFQIGVVNLIVVALASILLIKHRRDKNVNYKISFLALIFFLAAIFMMNIRSMFIWKIIPFTNFIQFPWRLLALTTFFSAFLAGFAVEKMKLKNIAAILLVLFSVMATFLYFRPSKMISRSEEEYIARFFNNPLYSEDYLQLPHAVSKKPDFVQQQRFNIEHGQIVSEVKVSDIFWKAEISAEQDTVVEAYVLDFPGWFVEVDGERVETSPGEPYGQMTFAVSSGVHRIELYWAETDLRQLANIVSLATLVVVAALYLSHRDSRATI